MERKDLWKQVMYEDGSQKPYFVFDLDETMGYAPVFIQSHGDRPDLYGEEISQITPRQGLLAETYLGFRVFLKIEEDSTEEDLLKIETKLHEGPLSTITTPAWALMTKDKKYVFGRNIENLFRAFSDFEETAYQFSLIFFLGDALVDIIGRFINGLITIDSSYGISGYPDLDTYLNYFPRKKLSRPGIHRFYSEKMFKECLEKSFKIRYLGGIWINNRPLIDPDQPEIGIFELCNEPDETLDQIFGSKFPKIRHDRNLVIPINYGVSSAVYFIRQKGRMKINRARCTLDNIYSIAGMDVH